MSKRLRDATEKEVQEVLDTMDIWEDIIKRLTKTFEGFDYEKSETKKSFESARQKLTDAKYYIISTEGIKDVR